MQTVRLPSRPLRTDAVRNQTRILDAAREVFRTSGLDVALDDIARHAGVGIATLYRRFSDRETLIVAVFELQMQNVITWAHAALAASDPWTGFTTLLTSLFKLIAEDKGMRQYFLNSRYDHSATADARRELIGLFGEVITRAQRAGALRPGITPHDIPPLMLMMSAVADFANTAHPQLWERYAALLVDGLSAQPGQSPLAPDALSGEATALAMAQG